MGKEEQTRSEFSESQLIDFLYIDKSRVDSLISQIRNGTLRSVTKTIGTSEGSFVSVEGGIPTVVSGKHEQSQNSLEQAAEKRESLSARFFRSYVLGPRYGSRPRGWAVAHEARRSAYPAVV